MCIFSSNSIRKVTVYLNGRPEYREILALDSTVDNLESLKKKWARVLKRKYNENSRLFYYNDGIEIDEYDLIFLKDEEMLCYSHKGEDFKYKQILEMYTQIEKIGQGGFGKVYLCEEKSTKIKYAIKYIDISFFMSKADLVKDIFRESKTLSVLQHKNIIGLKRTFLYHNNIVLIMDYAPDGELK